MRKLIAVLSVVALTLTGVVLAPRQASAMNKAELIEAMASRSGLSKADAKRALDGFVSSSTKALKKGDRLSLVGFGSFSISKRSARTGRAPEGNASVVEFTPEKRETGAAKRAEAQGQETVELEELKRMMIKTLTQEEGDKPSKQRPEEIVDRFFEVFFDTILDTVGQGEVVSLGEEFGTFYPPSLTPEVNNKSSRGGRNPQTGKEIKIAAKQTVKFKAGAELSKAVN